MRPWPLKRGACGGWIVSGRLFQRSLWFKHSLLRVHPFFEGALGKAAQCGESSFHGNELVVTVSCRPLNFETRTDRANESLNRHGGAPVEFKRPHFQDFPTSAE